VIEWLLDLVDHALDLLNGLDPLLLALATAAFTALETTALVGLVVPGDAAVLLASSTVDSPARFMMIVTAAAGGTYLGELAGYGIGRAVGPRLRHSRFGRFLGEQRWARAEAYLGGRGAPVLVPIRFVSVLHAVAPVVAGTVRMPLRRFALWAGAGAVLWAVVYTSLGTAAGAAYREYRGLGLLTTLAVICASAVVMYIRRWRRRRRERRERATIRALSVEEDRLARRR
jgi:membrane-associated protein